MIPAKQDISFTRGDTVSIYMRVKGRNPDGTAGPYYNLTGATAKSQIRSTAISEVVSAEFACVVDNQTLRPGGVLLTLTATQSAAVIIDKGVWDFQVTEANGEVSTYVGGAVTILGDVTR